LLAVAELVRMGELDERDVGTMAPELAEAVAQVAAGTSSLAAPALVAAGVVLAKAGERRALRDLAKLVGQTERGAVPEPETDAVDVVTATEQRIARGRELFPDGISTSWLGVDFEAHGLVVGPASRLSLAVRWHGRNAAVLWEVDGDPVTLTTRVATGGWTSDAPRGEALWLLNAPRDAISFT
jgi:hypothetical protein